MSNVELPMAPGSATPSDRPAALAFTRTRWSAWRVFIAAGAIYVAYRVPHLLIIKSVEPLEPPSTLTRVGLGLIDGVLVGLCAVAILVVGERLPIEKPNRLRNVAVHVLLAFVCSIVTLSALWAIGGILMPGLEPASLFVFNVVSITPTLFVFLAIAAIVQAVTYQRRFRDRELDALRLRAQLTAARLESLRAKLHPHFLFNTLNGISDLIFTNPQKADALVLRLAELLRASLDTVDAEISVREELAMLTAYLDIERVRFGERLEVTIEADRAAFDARVPPFLVQPLAENAIQHGLAPRASGGAITLRALVRHRDKESRLVLELSDNGVGMAEDASEGIGLRITRQRLQALYREAGALTIQPRPGGGTVATVEIPFVSAAS